MREVGGRSTSRSSSQSRNDPSVPPVDCWTSEGGVVQKFESRGERAGEAAVPGETTPKFEAVVRSLKRDS